VAPPPPPAAPAAKAEDKDDDTNGLFGPFRIGPVIGVGVPNLVNFGVTAKLTRFLGFGVNVGVIPKVQLSLYGDATLSYQEYDAYGRLYPFGGSFFLGAGVGYATMKGSYSNTIAVPAAVAAFVPPGTELTVETDGKVRSLVLTPQIGFFKTFGSGFSIGIDVGAQMPLAPSTVNATTSVTGLPAGQTTPEIQDQITSGSAKVRDTLDRVGQQIIPTFNLKIGFLLLATRVRGNAPRRTKEAPGSRGSRGLFSRGWRGERSAPSRDEARAHLLAAAKFAAAKSQFARLVRNVSMYLGRRFR
jgi:hypothetical protein